MQKPKICHMGDELALTFYSVARNSREAEGGSDVVVSQIVKYYL